MTSSRRSSALQVTSWLLPFALVVYLALRGGGYDSIVRDQVAVALWLVVFVGLLAGILPAARVTRAAWVVLGLLGGFLLWSGVSAIWSDSVERSLEVVPLLGSYLAVLSFAVMTSSRVTATQAFSAIAAAIGLVAALALTSRYAPALFPVDETLKTLPEAASRLKYPLGSWNGLASLVGMGVPLLLAIAVDARTVGPRMFAAAAVPISVLAIGYTLSRSGVLTALIGVAAYVILHPRRASMIPTFAVICAGNGIALLGAAHFDELRNLTPGFESQQVPMAAITACVCAAVAVAMWVLAKAEHRGWHLELHFSRTAGRRVLAAMAVAGIAVSAIAGGQGRIADAWEQFKSPTTPGSTSERFASASGNLRYQQWDIALQAASEAPVGGKGAGTFQYWWARETEIAGYTQYAHSLYFESLAETGLIGVILVVGLIGGTLIALIRRTRSAPGHLRPWLAGASGSAAVFAIAMGVDWGWAIPAIPVAFFLLAGVALQSEPERERVPFPRLRRPALCSIPVVLSVVAAISWLGAQWIADSQESAQAGDLDVALDAAERAGTLQPYAATPHLQKALVLEEQGDYNAAAFEAGVAVEKDLFNWHPRWVLSRIAERSGDSEMARYYFDQARQYNPVSPYFTQDRDQSALTPLE